MSRRITRKTPDSLKDLKAKEDVAVAAASSARKQTEQYGAQLAEMRIEGEKKAEYLKKLDENVLVKEEQIAVLEHARQDLDDEVRKAEGALATKLTEALEVGLLHEQAVKEQVAELEEAKSNFKDQRASYERMLTNLKKEVEESQLTKIGLSEENRHFLGVVDKLEEESKRLKAVNATIPGLEEELGNLNHQLLVKQAETKDVEDALQVMRAKHNGEKSKFEEVAALRLGEEQRIDGLRQQLIVKEDEVDKKMRSMKALQAGIDQVTKRLKRREQELELKNHLAKPKEKVTKK